MDNDFKDNGFSVLDRLWRGQPGIWTSVWTRGVPDYSAGYLWQHDLRLFLERSLKSLPLITGASLLVAASLFWAMSLASVSGDLAVRNDQVFGINHIMLVALLFAAGSSAIALIAARRERKRAKKALRESERRLAAAQKIETVGQLSAGVAHDFNNLLTVIAGNVELHLEQLPANASTELLSDVKQAVEMGERLTERLLTISSRRTAPPDTLDLNACLRSMSELLSRTLGGSIEVRLNLAADLGLVRVDPGDVENAVLNLVINARDAMPRGGRLSAVTRNVKCRAGAGVTVGDYVLLTISDSGVGMVREVVEHAFEPFFTTKDPGQGTGLGLASVYAFVKRGGGHVKIRSEPGKGTAVSMYFPKFSAGARPMAEPRSGVQRAMAAGRTVLVVEDNHLVRRTALRKVAALGFRVIEADSAGSALDILGRGERVDIVFSDVVMPGGLSGFDLAQWAAASNPHIHVVLTSGLAVDIPGDRSGSGPSFTIIRKPYSDSDLIRAFATNRAHAA
jgi:signal transduction histidine kinase